MNQKKVCRFITKITILAVLCLILLPLMSIQAKARTFNQIKVSDKKLYMQVYQPFAGDSTSDICVGTASGKYTGTGTWNIKENWVDEVGNTLMNKNDKFEAGKTYVYTLMVTADLNTFPNECNGFEFYSNGVVWDRVISNPDIKDGGNRIIFKATTTARSYTHDVGPFTIDLTKGSATYTGDEATRIYHTANYTNFSKILGEVDSEAGIIFDLNDDNTGDIKVKIEFEGLFAIKSLTILVLDTCSIQEDYSISKDQLNLYTLEMHDYEYYDNLKFVFKNPTNPDAEQTQKSDTSVSNTSDDIAKENINNKQKTTKFTKVKAGKKSITLNWKKQAAKGIKGYEIQCSSDKNFSKDTTKTVTIKKVKTTKTTIKKLKSKTKYYVKIRTFSIKNGEKVYSKWSKPKNVKVK